MGPVNTSRLLTAFALLLLLAAIPAAAQVNDTYVIAAAANSPGSFGTRWMTQFSVFNPHLDHTLYVSVTYLPTGGAQGVEELIELPPNSVAWSDNLLSELFGVQGGGSLLVATFASDNPGVPDNVLARSFLVTSSTYNNAASGTYGQTIPGVWTGLMDIDSDGITAIAHNIRNIARDGWRTNVGALNLGRCTVTMRVTVYDADGHTLLSDAPMILPPQGHLQQGLPIEVENGSVEFYVEDPCAADDDLYAVVFPYTSTIDQLSGDPTYQVPTLLASPGSIYAAKAASIDPTTFGTKLTSAYALKVRQGAERRGMATLTRTAKGLRIGR
jgi:hypothetical protein